MAGWPPMPRNGMNASVPDCPAFPDWLEASRVPDNLFDAAYNAMPARFRALIKTAIAIADFHFGENPGIINSSTSKPASGFAQSTASAPANAAIIIFTPEHAAPARLCAAAVLPILGGVRDVLALCLGGAPGAAALATLELCGVNDVFCPPVDLFEKFLVWLWEYGARNSRLFITNAASGIANLARSFPAPCYIERFNPRLFVAEPDLFLPENLVFALGKMPKTACRGHADAIYCAATSVEKFKKEYPDCPLFIAPGCEGFWLYPGLRPDFFRSEQLAFSMPDNFQQPKI